MRFAVMLKLLLVCACAVMGGCGGGGPGSLQRYEYRRLCMGVEARVVLYAEGEHRAAAGARAAYARMAELEQVFSDYRPDSEVMRLCGRAGQGPVEVSRDLLEVLRLSGVIHDATGGAFDPTVGALSALWREARGRGELPSAEAIARARECVGWEHVKVDEPRGTVEVDCAGLRMDFGGIAKGYAAAEAVKTLRGMGLPRAMVALAGDIAAGEPPVAKRGWSVEVDPGMEGVEPFEVDVRNASVSTSGDREQFVEVGGVRYSHILNPRTGLGMTRRVAACVVSSDGAVADAVATGLCAMDPAADGLGRLLRATVVKESETKVWVWRE